MIKRVFTFLLILVLGINVTEAARFRAKHVVLIAIDGWGSYSMDKANIPNIRCLMDRGCYTLRKRSVFPTSSAINWASMFMGVGTELHGYTQWGSRIPEIPSRITNKNGISPTIFSIAREQYPDMEMGCLYEWEGIKYLVDTLSLSFHKQAVDCERYPDLLCRMAEQYIEEKKPDILAVCFDQLDHIGHIAGHNTPSYYRKLEEIDAYVGRIVKALEEADMYDDCIVMLTADHGGIGKNHGGITLEETETPFIIVGKNVKKGGCFEESMMQFDVAATMAYVFRLEPPQVWIGRPMKQVFNK